MVVINQYFFVSSQHYICFANTYKLCHHLVMTQICMVTCHTLITQSITHSLWAVSWPSTPGLHLAYSVIYLYGICRIVVLIFKVNHGYKPKQMKYQIVFSKMSVPVLCCVVWMYQRFTKPICTFKGDYNIHGYEIQFSILLWPMSHGNKTYQYTMFLFSESSLQCKIYASFLQRIRRFVRMCPCIIQKKNTIFWKAKEHRIYIEG